MLLVSDTSHPPTPSSRPSFPQLLPQLCSIPARARFVAFVNFCGVNTPTLQATNIKSLDMELGRRVTVLPGTGASQPQCSPEEVPLLMPLPVALLPWLKLTCTGRLEDDEYRTQYGARYTGNAQ